MKLFLTGLIILSSINLFADEFDDLKKKQAESFKKDPFASNKAVCSTRTEKGITLTETWSFFQRADGGTYLRDLGGILQKGSYEVKDDMLILKQTSSSATGATTNEFNYKYKLKATGYEYIHTTKKGDKLLYSCSWRGKA